MARVRLCKACGEWHSTEEPWPEGCFGHWPSASAGAGAARFYVRTDGMDPIQSMVSGKFHDSKSAYYREVRAAGCEIVGEDRAGFGKRPEYKPQGVAQSIKRAIESLS